MSEYSNELIFKCKTNFYHGFKSIYETVEKKNKNKKYILRDFQEALEFVPLWNSNIIENEYKRFKKNTKCGWLDDLIQASFLNMAKELLKDSVQKSSIQLVIPSGPNFIHKCYINIARELWKNPKLYYQKVSRDELKNSIEDIYEIISEQIIHTLRNDLPFKDVLHTYLNKSNSNPNVDEENEYDEDTDDEDTDDEDTDDEDTDEDNAIEDNSVKDKDNSIEDNAVEDNAVEDNAVEDNSVKGNAVEDNSIEEDSVKDKNNYVEDNDDEIINLSSGNEQEVVVNEKVIVKPTEISIDDNNNNNDIHSDEDNKLVTSIEDLDEQKSLQYDNKVNVDDAKDDTITGDEVIRDTKDVITDIKSVDNHAIVEPISARIPDETTVSFLKQTEELTPCPNELLDSVCEQVEDVHVPVSVDIEETTNSVKKQNMHTGEIEENIPIKQEQVSYPTASEDINHNINKSIVEPPDTDGSDSDSIDIEIDDIEGNMYSSDEEEIQKTSGIVKPLNLANLNKSYENENNELKYVNIDGKEIYRNLENTKDINKQERFDRDVKAILID